MTSPMLQNDVQTFFEVIDYGMARVYLKIYQLKISFSVPKNRELILCSPEHLNRIVHRQKNKYCLLYCVDLSSSWRKQVVGY